MATLPLLAQHILAHPRLTGLAAYLVSPWVTIFMLHRLNVPELGVQGTDPEYLRRCLSYLKRNGYEFISIEDAVASALDNRLARKKWVAFSLDDGLSEQVAGGSKIFQEFDCPSTCFLITDFIDGKLWPWDYQLMYVAAEAREKSVEIEIAGSLHKIEFGAPETADSLLSLVRRIAPATAYEAVRLIAASAGVDIPERAPDSMRPTTWSEVRAAEKAGMKFGPHSAEHRILAALDGASIEQEIAYSQLRLRQECANPSRIFCYPSGKATEFDERSIAIARKLGFVGALSAEEGFMESHKLQQYANYRYVIPRLPLPDDFAEFTRYVSWAQYVRERMAKNPLEVFLNS